MKRSFLTHFPTNFVYVSGIENLTEPVNFTASVPSKLIEMLKLEVLNNYRMDNTKYGEYPFFLLFRVAKDSTFDKTISNR